MYLVRLLTAKRHFEKECGTLMTGLLQPVQRLSCPEFLNDVPLQSTPQLCQQSDRIVVRHRAATRVQDEFLDTTVGKPSGRPG